MNCIRRWLGFVSGLFLTIILLTGCGGSKSDRIIYLNFDGTDKFGGILIRDAILKGAESKGLKIDYFDAKGDSNTQIDQMKDALEANPQAIVLLAIDGDGIIPFVERANKLEIPIVTVNRDANGGDRIRVYSDEYEAGKLQAEYFAKSLPQGANVVYLEGASNLLLSVQRWEGFSKELKAKRSDVHILDMQDGKWSKAEAMKIMSLWLSSYPKIDAVVCANDQMAFGAIAALKAANRLAGCQVSGIDAVDEALKAVENGEMVQTVKQDGIAQAAGVVTALEQISKGGKPTDINVPFTSITKENLSQFKK
ncbi:MAG: sugar ABC transporter substrate-binding protein [Selenomonadaceae bacterium]|nr:sugar ABC transporter substrate-binding protein [Selenomonadaceae bacterium]